MFFNVLFGILYVGGIIAAGIGTIGAYNLFLSESRIGILGHVLVWLASTAVFAGLITVAASNQWGPFDPNSCSKARPCVRVIQDQR